MTHNVMLSEHLIDIQVSDPVENISVNSGSTLAKAPVHRHSVDVSEFQFNANSHLETMTYLRITMLADNEMCKSPNSIHCRIHQEMPGFLIQKNGRPHALYVKQE